jgi:hypothetical protein
LKYRKPVKPEEPLSQIKYATETMLKWIAAVLLNFLSVSDLFSQSEIKDQHFYPKAVGYMSFVLPLVKFNKDETTNDFENFKNNFAIGFPVGINILYSDKFGFSFEITPTIKAGNGTTKTSNVTFSPGPMFRFSHGLVIISRLAFETSGRYGVTPVLSKVIIRSRIFNYFISGSLPVRFGNNELPSIGINFQFGLIFN